MKTSSMVKLLVLKRAQRWWELHRPVCWTLEQHLASPTINVSGEGDAALARAVAAMLKESWRVDDASPLVKDLYDLVKALENSGAKSRPDRHLILRRAEAFLGMRVVSSTPVPVEREKRKGQLHEAQQARFSRHQG